jgi:phytoene desaturase
LIHFLERNWGVFFPRGGTGALVAGLVRYFRELGGEISLNAEIAEIVSTGESISAVRTQTGEIWECDAVVSNGDVVHTYRDLLKNNPAGQKKTKSLLRQSYSMSLFLIYFGTDRTYPHLAHHNVVFGPRYKGLLDDIFVNGTLPNDFSLYLHRASATDPNLAPEGGDCFYVLAPVAHMGNLDTDWSKMGPIYADKILSYLEAKYMPDLKKHLVTQRIFSPADFKSELNSHLGSAFSLEPKLTQSAYFRLHNKDPRIRGLYFVGAGTHPGAGIPGVVNSAKATAGLMIEDLNHG